MASKNQVTLTFAGDADKLTKAMKAVGDDAEKLSDRVDDAGKSMSSRFDGSAHKSRRSLDDISDGADRGEQRIIGLRDAFTGAGDTMAGVRNGDMVLFLTGLGDLASSVANFAGPVLSALASKLGLTALATKVQTVATTALNAVMRANPLLLVITGLTLLAGALVLAYQRSSTFRSIVQAAFGAVKSAADAVVNAVQGIVSAMVAAWKHPVVQAITAPYRVAFSAIHTAVDAVVDVIGKIPGALRAVKDWAGWSALQNGAGAVFSAIKGVINTVSDAVSNLISKLQSALDWVGKVASAVKNAPGNLLSKLPGFASGGIVTGRMIAEVGEDGPEAIIPLTKPRRAAAVMRAAGLTAPGGGGGGVHVHVQAMYVRSDSDVEAIAARLGRMVALAP